MCFIFVSCVLTEDPESVEERKEEEAYFDIQEAGGWREVVYVTHSCPPSS